MTDTITPPTKFAHLVLKTSRLKAQLEFYQLLLGARIVHQGPGLAFLTYDEEHHRIAFIEQPGLLPRIRNMSGVDHHAYTYADLATLLGTWKRMTAAGHEPVWCTHHGPTISIYYSDADGNVIETQVDVFETMEEASEFLSAEDFQSNPIGVDFDPAVLLERLESGEPWETLKLRTPSGPRSPASVPRAYLGGFAWTMLQIQNRLSSARSGKT